LTVSIADCVPVFVVDPAARRVALLHAGWRGAAGGILERGLAELPGTEGASELFVHLGPSICGQCYEVGPEVFEALDLPRPGGPTPIDLRAVLAERAVKAGVEPSHVSVSERCTRCEGGVFFSHRGGDAGRQVAYLGIRG
jgi:copper oxidase (laccase) domain-containing protein